MSRSPAGRWLPITLLFWGLGYLAAALWAFFTFPDGTVLPLFRGSWVFRNAFRVWMEYLPALTAGSLMLSFSLFFRSLGSSAGRGSFFGTVFPGIMAWGIALTLLYTVGAELLLPRVYRQLNDITYQSGRAKEWERQGEIYEAAGDFSEALDAYSRALVIDPDNQELVLRKEGVEGKIPLAEPGPEAGRPDSREERASLQLEAAQAIQLAEEAFARQDYFTAHYWALFAHRLDPEQRNAAMKIAREAWDSIDSLEPDPDQLELYGVYREKIAGYRALEQGDAVQAYRIFLELSDHREGAADPDIAEFLERSRKAAEQVSFYAATAREAESMPGLNSILFRDGADGPFVTARKLVALEGKVFLLGLELLHVDEAGDAVLHLSAPAARFQGDTLLLRGIDEDTGGVVMSASLLEGTGTLFRGEGWMVDTEVGLLTLGAGQEEFWSLGSGLQRDAMSDIASLYRSAVREKQYGYFEFSGSLELLYRGSMPFFFLNTLILSAGMGRFLRYRGSRFPFLAVFLIPAVPFLAGWVLDLLAYGLRLTAALLVITLPFALALALLLGMHGLVMFLVLLFAAGQRDG